MNSIWYRFFEVLSASITEHLQNSFTLTKLLVLNKAITGSPVNFGPCAGLLHCLTEQLTLLAYAHFMLSCYTSLLHTFSLIPRLCARMFAPHLGVRPCTPYAQLFYCMLKHSMTVTIVNSSLKQDIISLEDNQGADTTYG